MADSVLFTELASVELEVEEALGTLLDGTINGTSFKCKIDGFARATTGAQRTESQDRLTATIYDPTIVVRVGDRMTVGTQNYRVTGVGGLRRNARGAHYVTTLEIQEF